jgi:hypothetical protein
MKGCCSDEAHSLQVAYVRRVNGLLTLAVATLGLRIRSLPKEGAVQAGEARNEAYVPVDTLAEEPQVERWSRRSRFLFIVGAATLCWVIPGLAIYLLIAPT